MARALCEASAEADGRCAPGPRQTPQRSSSWPGHQRRSRSCYASIARVSFDNVIHGARLQRGHPPQEAASGAFAPGALRQMQLHPSACVYVGDAPQDVEMARRAGVSAIGVLGPFPTEKRLRAAGPEFLIGSIEELPDTLKKLHC